MVQAGRALADAGTIDRKNKQIYVAKKGNTHNTRSKRKQGKGERVVQECTKISRKESSRLSLTPNASLIAVHLAYNVFIGSD